MRSTRTAAILATAVVGFGGIAAIATGKTAAKGKADSGTSYISIVHVKGKSEYAAGYTFDKLFGQTAATYITSVTAGKQTGTIDITVKKVVLYTSTGTLYGTGKAVQNLTTGAITNGKLDLTHGTGGQKGHSLIGTVSGTFDSKAGVYTFKYKGTYK